MPLNIAIIGPGSIADNQLAPALEEAEGAQLWSVLSRDKGRSRDFARKHNAKSPNPAYDDLKLLLQDPELDAVIIATPDKLHAEQTIESAKAGKHVLVEKPMATDVESGRKMVDACRQANVKLAVAYHLRWHRGHRKMWEFVRSGGIGEIRHMLARWTWKARDASNWRASPDVGYWWGLAGVGTHCLDFIRWFMIPGCGEVDAVESLFTSTVWNSPHDETAILALQFESGATAEVCSSVLFNSPPRAEIYGSEGFVIFDETLGPHGGGKIRTSKEEEVKFEVANPYTGEIEDFVESIVNDRTPEVDGEEGLRNVEILVEASKKTGREYYAS